MWRKHRYLDREFEWKRRREQRLPFSEDPIYSRPPPSITRGVRRRVYWIFRNKKNYASRRKWASDVAWHMLLLGWLAIPNIRHSKIKGFIGLCKECLRDPMLPNFAYYRYHQEVGDEESVADEESMKEAPSPQFYSTSELLLLGFLAGALFVLICWIVEKIENK